MTTIHEGYVRRTRYVSIECQLPQPIKVLEHDPTRLWAAVICAQTTFDLGVTTNPLSALGQPDCATFLAAQGAMYFETYGTNEVYLLNLPIGTDIAITTMVRDPKALFIGPTGQQIFNAEKIETVTGGGAVATAVGGFQAFLPADQSRTRALVKTDAALALLCDGVDATNFMPFSPFFPGYGVVESSDAIAFSTLAGSINNAWYILDRKVAV